MKKRSPDKILLYSFAALLVAGLLALFSAAIPQSRQDFGNIYGYFLHQLIWGFFIGSVAALIMYKFSYKKLQKLSPLFFLASLFLMMLVFIPGISVESSGAQRWIDFGAFTFQPSELVKLTFIVYLGAWLSTRLKKSEENASLAPFLMFLGVLAFLLLLQPDLSTFGIIALTAGVMYFAAGAPIRHLVYLSTIGTAAFYLFVKISPYRISRIITLLNPEGDPLGAGYQINQALIAVGAGKIWGFGLLSGLQKAHVPLAMNDSIFAVWAEETGFIGAVILILLYIIISWRGFWLAEKIKDRFAKITITGLTTWIFFQAIINIGSIVGLVPLTGVTLPFISYGASSLVVVLAAAGLMMQLSKEAT